MLNGVLSMAALRRVIQEIPDARIAPYGGPWGTRIPDVNADHDELIEFDRTIPPAADLLGVSAQSRDVIDKPTEVILNKAFRIKSSNKLTQEDMRKLLAVQDSNGVNARTREGLLTMVARHIERRKQSVAITRGLLLAGMACGELSWNVGGIQFGTIDFNMPAQMKIVPNTYWRANTGAANTGATPVSDIAALDQAARNLNGAPFTAMDLAMTQFLAMIATTEYQNQAKAVAAVYSLSALPVGQSPAALQLAKAVLGKEITLVDNIYEYENLDGTRTTGRYVPEKYATFYRTSEIGSGVAYDFANCPLTESAVASAAGATAFGGEVVRGPWPYSTHDTDFAWIRIHATQEGTPRRFSRTATGRILTQEPGP